MVMVGVVSHDEKDGNVVSDLLTGEMLHCCLPTDETTPTKSKF